MDVCNIQEMCEHVDDNSGAKTRSCISSPLSSLLLWQPVREGHSRKRINHVHSGKLGDTRYSSSCLYLTLNTVWRLTHSSNDVRQLFVNLLKVRGQFLPVHHKTLGIFLGGKGH